MLIQTQAQTARSTRHKRTPNFPIAGVMKPFGLYPIWAHPVLPGETVQSITTKVRTISLPVNHPMAGAWLEYWYVYIKLTDLDRDLGQMFISDTYSTTGWTAGADNKRTFTKSGKIDWVGKCLERFHAAYFIHENETARTVDSGLVPQVKLNNRSWYQNMMFEAADAAVPVTDASDTYEHLQGWAILQQMQMTELTYEKYLQTFGATPARAAQGDPEILRFGHSWTQPVNTVEPTTGAPSSAWVWSDEIKLEKAKRFDEPGFLCMFATVRPKLYQKHLEWSLLGNLWGFSDWFPSYTLQDPTAGVKEMQTDDGVFLAASRGDAGELTLLYDHRDLLSHGEQFVNEFTTPYDLPVSTGLMMNDASEPEDLRGEYCVESDVAALFVGASPFCYYEGMGFAVISGHVTDSTT